MNNNKDDLSVMLNKTMVYVENIYDTVLRFVDTEGTAYEFYHYQDCCESVYIEDICGDLQDLVGNPILLAEEISNNGFSKPEVEDSESFTWTFYKFATIKGYVDVRWFGSSNGYYSEAVYFNVIKPNK